MRFARWLWSFRGCQLKDELLMGYGSNRPRLILHEPVPCVSYTSLTNQPCGLDDPIEDHYWSLLERRGQHDPFCSRFYVMSVRG